MRLCEWRRRDGRRPFGSCIRAQSGAGNSLHLAVGRNPMGHDSAKRIAKGSAVLVRDASAPNVRRELEKPRTFEGDVEIWVSGSWRLPRIQRGPPVEAEPSGSAL